MKEVIKELSKPLSAEDVELRVGQVSAKGFSLLLYKTARTDVKRLNDTGAIWKNEHNYDKHDLLTCTLSVYDTEHNIWIDRTDVGKESQTEKDKGNYSDSFKRAGFRWGIGLELYNAPFVWLNWDIEERNGRKVPKGFFASNLSITEYEVEDGHFRKLTVEYAGKGVVFSMRPKANSKPPVKETPPQKKELKIEYASEDDVLTIESLITQTKSDKTKFLLAFKVDKIESLPKANVTRAVELLTSKMKKAS